MPIRLNISRKVTLKEQKCLRNYILLKKLNVEDRKNEKIRGINASESCSSLSSRGALQVGRKSYKQTKKASACEITRIYPFFWNDRYNILYLQSGYKGTP